MRFKAATLLAALLLPACGGVSSGGGKPSVLVSILPQAWFAERIAGDRFSVEVLVGPGQSPHTFEPTPKKIAAVAACRAWFLSGMPFERVLISGGGPALSNLRSFDSRRGIVMLAVGEHGCQDCAGGEDGKGGSPEGPEAGDAAGGEGERGRDAAGHADHGHGLEDPHFWLDPVRAAVMAANLCEGFCEIDPEGAATFRKNLELLTAELEDLGKRLSEKLSPFRGAEVLVFHPAFGYFLDRFGLVQRAVETDGKEPGPRSLAALIEQAKARRVKVVFVQPQFPRTSAQAIASGIGGAVVPLDPLAFDYTANLEAMAAAIAEALGR